MTGFKTVVFGAALATIPPALDYFGAVDWQTLGISPRVAALLGSVVIVLRAVTTTPIFKNLKP